MSESDHPFPRLLPVKCSLCWKVIATVSGWDHGIICQTCGIWAQNLIPFQNKQTPGLKTHFLKGMDFLFCFLSLFWGRFNQRGWKHISAGSLVSFHTSFLVWRMFPCGRNQNMCGLLLPVPVDEGCCYKIVFQSKASEYNQFFSDYKGNILTQY